MAAMLATAVVTAGVTGFAVRMVMVVTMNIGIVAQASAEQCVHRRVSLPADTAIELDARFGECCLRTAADASAIEESLNNASNPLPNPPERLPAIYFFPLFLAFSFARNSSANSI